MITETVIHFDEDVQRMLCILPQSLQEFLNSHASLSELIEVVMDIGHVPTVRFDHGHERLTHFNAINQADIDMIVEQVGDFNSDNRAGIEATLHRISAIRNRQGKILGLSLRIGRAVIGSIKLIEDLVKEGKTILILGPPGVGKPPN